MPTMSRFCIASGADVQAAAVPVHETCGRDRSYPCSRAYDRVVKSSAEDFGCSNPNTAYRLNSRLTTVTMAE